MKDVVKFWIAVIVGIAAILSFFIGLMFGVEYYQCTQIDKYSPQVDANFHNWAGCYITEDGKTFPMDKWRNDE